MKTSNCPSVTIGVCVKNNETTVASALKSIFKADYSSHRLEIVIVDGMSKDKTLDVIEKELRNTNIPIRLLQDNGKGLAYARQMVVDEAKGRYIIWIDGDNLFSSEFIKNHVEFMESNSRVGVASAGFIPRGSGIVAKLQGYQWLIPSLERIDAKNTMLAKTGAQGTICRTLAIREVGGFDQSIKGAGEDVDLFLRIASKGWRIAINRKAKISHFMRQTWKSLWDESCWWGYGTYYIKGKHKSELSDARWHLGSVISDCVKITIKSAKVTGDAVCLLMPFHYALRRLGFLAGEIRARRDGYRWKNHQPTFQA